jgi:hypothetical protein
MKASRASSPGTANITGSELNVGHLAHGAASADLDRFGSCGLAVSTAVSTVRRRRTGATASGRDVLEGRAGADTFVYRSAADSTSLAHDRIVGFVFGEDLIDLPGSHDAFEVKSGGALSLASFDEDLAAAMAGTLEAMEAVLFTADAGDLAGRLFLIVDQNGAAGYQAGEDFVIELAGTAARSGRSRTSSSERGRGDAQ